MTPRYIITDLRTDQDYVRATLDEVRDLITLAYRLDRYQVIYYERANAAGSVVNLTTSNRLC